MRAINQPVSWWGWHWQPPVPLSIVEIMAAGSMPSRLIALLWVGMERGASLLVAANPPLAGKTTILTALMSLTPPETLVYFTRGIGESFALPPPAGSHPTYLLVNEMSDHLPVYTWGRYARRAFELLCEGYSLGTTMHADSAREVIQQLEGELGVPRRQIARLTFILSLHVAYGARQRRVREVAFLRPRGGGLALRTIARWQEEGDRFQVLDDPVDRQAFARWAGLSGRALEGEVERRASFLEGLLARGVTSIPQVNAAIEAYYRGELGPGGGGRRAGR